jgi:23S rRNA pseudouridine2605 synthase
MLAKLGHKVRDLTRIRMGPLTIDGLDPGEYRPLTGREVRELKNLGNATRSKSKRSDTDERAADRDR